MRRPRVPAAVCPLVAALLLLAGCGKGGDDSVRVVAIGEPASAFEAGGRLSPAAQLLRGATAQGLVTLDEAAQVVPGVAERWIVTDDGLSYIFRLRDGGWSNGAGLSAETVRQSLVQAIAALRGTPLARDLGAIRDIRAMTGRVVEIRLHYPQPDLLLLLAQPELGLLHRGAAAGPMRSRRDGTVAYLTPLDPELRGMSLGDGWEEDLRPLRFAALPATAAIASFSKGEVNAILGGRFEHFPLVDSDGLARGGIRLDPVLGLFGLALVHADGFLADPANREAIAMAIDRDALAARLGVAGWVATNRILPVGVEGVPQGSAERWADQTLADRQALAAARVARWRENGDQPVRLRIALPRGPGADRIYDALAADLAKAGLATQRVGFADPADLRLVDAVARYPRPAWFFNQLSCEALRGSLCSPEADRLSAEATRSADPATRAALIAEAETKLTEANAFIPFGPPIRWSLLRGNTTGFAPNLQGYHPLMPLARRPN